MRNVSRILFVIPTCVAACAVLLISSLANGQTTQERQAAGSETLDGQLHHIRNGDSPEWDEFTTEPESTAFTLTFDSSFNHNPATLELTQHNVKQNWKIELNGKSLGSLHTDENPIIGFWSIPAGTLADGSSTLKISSGAVSSDDIWVGHVVLHYLSRNEVLNSARARVTVIDEATRKPIPCRLTVLKNEQLMTVGAETSDDQAVRPGVIYCRGMADFGLPHGDYTVLASRGPEYSLAESIIHLDDQADLELSMTIRREVSTPGLVSCDTHLHTLTHSGHGDASISERMLTVAGECIELPIATDHNKHIDYVPHAVKVEVDRYFTPVIGNEVTTKIGHFNVFPIESIDTPIPAFDAADWPAIFSSIHGTPNVQAVILNHARDIHSGYRPFGPEHHLALIGKNLDGLDLKANALEIINSGAQQTNAMQLVHDWMGMLNAGHYLTPVGSSDSHDVARFIPGQARTYIECDDSDVGLLDVDMAIRNFVAGRVVVSCGLLCNLRLNDQFGPGEIAPKSSEYVAAVDIIGPSWVQATEVEIFVNGSSVAFQEIPVADRALGGVKHHAEFSLTLSKNQDAFVVAVARGPGVRRLHWPIARPYQPTSTGWEPLCMSVTGAVWIDGDGDGKRTCARQYAQRLCETAENDFPLVVGKLADHDFSVALHAAARLLEDDALSLTETQASILQAAPQHVRDAFHEYGLAWRQSQIQRAGQPKSSQ